VPSTVSYWRGSNGSFTYNGIDRKDNAAGYVEGNVVPCCKTCNYVKKSMLYGDFMAFIIKVGRHQLAKG
jgi:hypothetical protein